MFIIFCFHVGGQTNWILCTCLLVGSFDTQTSRFCMLFHRLHAYCLLIKKWLFLAMIFTTENYAICMLCVPYKLAILYKRLITINMCCINWTLASEVAWGQWTLHCPLLFICSNFQGTFSQWPESIQLVVMVPQEHFYYGTNYPSH